MAIVTAFFDYEPIDILVADLIDLSAFSVDMAEKPADVADAD